MIMAPLIFQSIALTTILLVTNVSSFIVKNGNVQCRINNHQNHDEVIYKRRNYTYRRKLSSSPLFLSGQRVIATIDRSRQKILNDEKKRFIERNYSTHLYLTSNSQSDENILNWHNDKPRKSINDEPIKSYDIPTENEDKNDYDNETSLDTAGEGGKANRLFYSNLILQYSKNITQDTIHDVIHSYRNKYSPTLDTNDNDKQKRILNSYESFQSTLPSTFSIEKGTSSSSILDSEEDGSASTVKSSKSTSISDTEIEAELESEIEIEERDPRLKINQLFYTNFNEYTKRISEKNIANIISIYEKEHITSLLAEKEDPYQKVILASNLGAKTKAHTPVFESNETEIPSASATTSTKIETVPLQPNSHSVSLNELDVRVLQSILQDKTLDVVTEKMIKRLLDYGILNPTAVNGTADAETKAHNRVFKSNEAEILDPLSPSATPATTTNSSDTLVDEEVGSEFSSSTTGGIDNTERKEPTHRLNSYKHFYTNLNEYSKRIGEETITSLINSYEMVVDSTTLDYENEDPTPKLKTYVVVDPVLQSLASTTTISDSSSDTKNEDSSSIFRIDESMPTLSSRTTSNISTGTNDKYLSLSDEINKTKPVDPAPKTTSARTTTSSFSTSDIKKEVPTRSFGRYETKATGSVSHTTTSAKTTNRKFITSDIKWEVPTHSLKRNETTADSASSTTTSAKTTSRKFITSDIKWEVPTRSFRRNETKSVDSISATTTSARTAASDFSTSDGVKEVPTRSFTRNETKAAAFVSPTTTSAKTTPRKFSTPDIKEVPTHSLKRNETTAAFVLPTTTSARITTSNVNTSDIKKEVPTRSFRMNETNPAFVSPPTTTTTTRITTSNFSISDVVKEAPTRFLKSNVTDAADNSLSPTTSSVKTTTSNFTTADINKEVPTHSLKRNATEATGISVSPTATSSHSSTLNTKNDYLTLLLESNITQFFFMDPVSESPPSATTSLNSRINLDTEKKELIPISEYKGNATDICAVSLTAASIPRSDNANILDTGKEKLASLFNRYETKSLDQTIMPPSVASSTTISTSSISDIEKKEHTSTFKVKNSEADSLNSVPQPTAVSSSATTTNSAFVNTEKKGNYPIFQSNETEDANTLSSPFISSATTANTTSTVGAQRQEDTRIFERKKRETTTKEPLSTSSPFSKPSTSNTSTSTTTSTKKETVPIQSNKESASISGLDVRVLQSMLQDKTLDDVTQKKIKILLDYGILNPTKTSKKTDKKGKKHASSFLQSVRKNIRSI